MAASGEGVFITDALERLGRHAAGLANKAAAGDEEALRELMGYRGLETNPQFATGMVTGLGPAGLVALPAALAKRFGNVDPKAHKPFLSMISGALATATNLKNRVNAGPPFLRDLKKAGRTSFPAGGVGSYRGYWGLGKILAATEGDTKYSRDFGLTIGRDMIDYDRELSRDPMTRDWSRRPVDPYQSIEE